MTLSRISYPTFPISRHFKVDQFPLAVLEPQRHEHSSMHAHEFTELVMIQAGQVVHVTETEEYPVKAGDVFVIHEGDAHGYRDGRKLILWNILYGSQRLLGPADVVRKIPGYHAMFCIEPRFRRRHGLRARLHLGQHDLAKALDLVSSIRAELAQQAPGYELLAAALFLQLVGLLSRRYDQRPAPSSRGLLRMGNVIGYIEERYDRPIRLEQLADLAHMSPRHLLRTFREATGLTPTSYLLRRRISKAMDLLQTEDMNVTEAAFAVGFTDSNYFSRQFRKITGLNPGSVRK